MILLRIFLESFRFACHAIVSNKLRTFLSLLGVTIGILAVISVLQLLIHWRKMSVIVLTNWK